MICKFSVKPAFHLNIHCTFLLTYIFHHIYAALLLELTRCDLYSVITLLNKLQHLHVIWNIPSFLWYPFIIAWLRVLFQLSTSSVAFKLECRFTKRNIQTVWNCLKRMKWAMSNQVFTQKFAWSVFLCPWLEIRFSGCLSFQLDSQ